MEDAGLLAAAGDGLARGLAPGHIFGDLVTAGAQPRAAAIAICVAAGTDGGEAEQRVRDYDDLWSLMEAGDEDAVGDVLEKHGYFDHEPDLNEEQAQVLSLLQDALAAVPGWPSGHAVGLFRRLRLGHFAHAVVLMEKLGAQRWAAVRNYWVKLSRAADAVTATQDAFVAARERCRRRAAG